MAGGVITAALIGGATSIIGGIMGASQADKQNAQAEEAYEEQMKLAQQAADKTNEYNKRVFEVDKQNYQNNRAYEWNTAARQWKYNTEIQDYQYLSAVKQFGKSVENTNSRLAYNSLAAMQAYEAEQS